MQSALSGCFGFFFGAFVGGALGVGAGMIWTKMFETSCFEGYCGMLVFLSFMPVGAILGGVIGASLLIVLANQAPNSQRDAARPTGMRKD